MVDFDSHQYFEIKAFFESLLLFPSYASNFLDFINKLTHEFKDLKLQYESKTQIKFEKALEKMRLK
jgi:hypothetical protein